MSVFLLKMNELIYKLSHRLRDPKGVIYNNYEKLQNGYALKSNSISSMVGPSKRSLVNVANFNTYNGGDALLSVVLRDYFDKTCGKSDWKKIHAHKPVDNSILNKINKSDGLIIGGGGLFLNGSNKNSRSGWQWDIPTKMIGKINVPIDVFMVGYNQFRGQKEFDDEFSDGLNMLVEKSRFFGLRNAGSITGIKKYLDSSLHSKIKLQPCVTSMLREVYPKLFEGVVVDSNRVAVNVAFDRPELRFGDRQDEILSELCMAIKYLSKNYLIDIVSHAPEDERFLIYAKRYQLKYRHIKLYRVSGVEVINYYKKISLTLGMRGHSQMIPFGCGNSIISLISHHKLRWFLEDNEIEDFGIELNSRGMKDCLIEKTHKCFANIKKDKILFADKISSIKKITDSNLSVMFNSF